MSAGLVGALSETSTCPVSLFNTSVWIWFGFEELARIRSLEVRPKALEISSPFREFLSEISSSSPSRTVFKIEFVFLLLNSERPQQIFLLVVLGQFLFHHFFTLSHNIVEGLI